MKAFTDTEKQQLQAKIEDEQERQRVLRENIQIEKDKESKRMKGIISKALSFKYGFLMLIICLLIWDVTLLLERLERRNVDYDEYGNLMIVLMLLFNHIAFFITEKGWLSRVMRTIAWIWIVFVFACIFWIF